MQALRDAHEKELAARDEQIAELQGRLDRVTEIVAKDKSPISKAIREALNEKVAEPESEGNAA
jgi:hypothetical protein